MVKIDIQAVKNDDPALDQMVSSSKGLEPSTFGETFNQETENLMWH